MNVLLASGGYPWTVIRVDDRKRYMDGLEAASVGNDIRPFATFLAEQVKQTEKTFELWRR
jgi:diaminopimelate epimerase